MITELDETQMQIGIDSFAAAYDDASLAVSAPDRPETLKAAFEGAYGVFLVTNFWQEGANELKQATAAVRAVKDAGVKHFIWFTLPNVEAISGGKRSCAGQIVLLRGPCALKGAAEETNTRHRRIYHEQR
jgi:hypothetical protein